ncbi:hypothetical protein BsWGS_01260 [Bradybaena similaris]
MSLKSHNTPALTAKKHQRDVEPSVETDKESVVSDFRNSEDITQTIRDRLCLWPTGDEIITLLMRLKMEQLCPSYRPSANTPEQRCGASS